MTKAEGSECAKPKCLNSKMVKMYRLTLVVFLTWMCGLNSVQAAEPVRYNRDVLPILADNCFACHGFDKSQREAELRLDVRESAAAELPSGVTAIVPGKPAESALWERVSATDEALLMPPPETGKRLTAAERDVLRRWIEQGAEYEPHWAYLPPQRVEPPPAAGSQSAIDRFIRSRLAAEKIEPSPEADRQTLLRRVTLDLTGLPPSPLEVDAFVNDPRDHAYERVVDRLLASVHFGERWARWWLDLAHYADTDGYLQDFLRPVAWRYRQWVVDAFNRDLPFDEFTIEQLAGDLLPAPTASQRMGTGFLRNTLSNREGGADLEEFRVKQVIDRTATVATTWLALTMGCAECHDHKFDTITQREFYQLYAFFNDADEVNFNAPLPGEREAWETAKQEHDRKRAELLAPVAAPLAELQADWERRMLETEAHPGQSYAWDRALELLGLQWGQDLGEGQLEGLNIIKTPLASAHARSEGSIAGLFPQPPAGGIQREVQRAENKRAAKQVRGAGQGRAARDAGACDDEGPGPASHARSHSGRFPSTGRSSAARHAGGAAASARRQSRRPSRVGALARLARAPADCTRGGEPAVAGVVRSRSCGHFGELWHSRRLRVAPRTTRLAGR